MHYHTEIIMPPCDDIEAAVTEIMEPFKEEVEDNCRPFWDFWVIGGRWAGMKLQSSLNKNAIKKFHKELFAHNVTVSSLQCGKQELSPASQIPMVDKLWHDIFPDAPDGPCPLYAHSNDQYSNDSRIDGDIQRFADVAPALKMSRLIFAALNYDETKLEAVRMYAKDIWNGVNHERTVWKTTFGHSVELFTKAIANYTDEYREKVTPKDDWLVVTVDYHC